MLVVNKMFINMVKQITREMMMIMLVIAPVLAGTFFRIGISILEKYVLSRYGLESILVSYYEMFSWLLAMLIGMLFAFVGGLVILGEIDDNITKYIMITPAGMKGYLWSRIMIPAILSGIAALVCIPIFSLVSLGFYTLVVMVIATMLNGIVTALLVVSISSNKVEGMAIGKISGFFCMAFFIPLLVRGMIKYVFILFPMFWIGEWNIFGGVEKLIIAFFEFALWIYFLFVRFRKKMIL